jgi:hypothetical protein
MLDRPLPPKTHEDVVLSARAFLIYFESVRPAEERCRREDVVEAVSLTAAIAIGIVGAAVFGIVSVPGVLALSVAIFAALVLRQRVQFAAVRRRHYRFMAEVAAEAHGIDVRYHAIVRQRLVGGAMRRR